MESEKAVRSDADLIERFLSDRSERNFLAIYRQHAMTMYRLALHLVGYSDCLAQEAVQDTWVTVVQKMDQFENRSAFKTWVTGILINKCRELNKLEKRHDHQDLSKAAMNIITHNVSINLDLQAAIGQLSPGYRDVLVLHDAEGYTHQEIAVILEINEGTSKSQLFHARKHVRKYLIDSHG